MYKKILMILFLLFSFSGTAYGKDRYVFFVERTSYDELNRYENIRGIINSSLKGLVIQRNNGEDFGFFESLKEGRPSFIRNKDIPRCIENKETDKIKYYGSVDLGGISLMPPKILFYGQTNDGILKYDSSNYQKELDNTYTHVVCIKNLKELDGYVSKLKDKTIIICCYIRNPLKTYDFYLQPFVYYNGYYKGCFYSNTTRNSGLIDYENARDIILYDNFNTVKVVNGNINKIYEKRTASLKSKRIFLTIYGYALITSALVSGALLKYNKKKSVSVISSAFFIMPLAVLVEPVFNFSNIYMRILIIALLSISAAFIKKDYLFKTVPVIFLLIIYADAGCLNFLLKNSLLSYEPALGARFYGIGNEYLGVILVYSIVLSEIYKKQKIFIFALNSILLLWDKFGSNFGGFLTCAAFSLLFYSKKLIFFYAAALLIIVKGSDNHIKTFFNNFLHSKYDYTYHMIGSKIDTFTKLLSFSLWIKISAAITIIYVYEILKGKIKFEKDIIMFGACCIMAIIFNDSGIVSASIMLGIYLNFLFYKTSMVE